MSAGQVQVLEDLLARVQQNREAQGLRLRLAHEALLAPQPSAPTAAPLEAEPPSTKDFGTPLAAAEAAVVESQPVTRQVAEPALADDSPVIEMSESAPEIVVDDDVEIYVDDIPSKEPSTLDAVESSQPTPDVSQEPMTQPRPTDPRPERIAQEEAVAKATREPITQPRPPAPEPQAPESEIVDEPTAEPVTRGAPAIEPAPATTAPVTKVSLEPPTSSGVPRSAVDPNAITAKRQKQPLQLDGVESAPSSSRLGKRPPPLPGSDTVVSEPPAPADRPEAELKTPAPPDAAPAIAGRQAVEPKVIQPQFVRTAQVAEMIGEIEAMKADTFGHAIDATLSLGI